MPQIRPDTDNIITFGFDVKIDIENRSMLFDIATLTNFNTGGQNSVLGVAFSLIDSNGGELMGVDWSNPQILPSSGTLSYTLDLSNSSVSFLFQSYSIIGYIKDQDGTVYNTVKVYKTIKQPVDLNEDGTVCGSFEIIPDCFNNIITVKEFTVFTYDNAVPQSVTKSGILYYPTGTIAPLSFQGTPLSNNNVYTGEYRINCTTIATYDLGDDVYVLVTYFTDSTFQVTCSNFLGDITCCLTDVYNTYLRNCENAIGQAALQKYNSVFPSVLNGLVKQMNGQNASIEVAEIKKTLNCNCGKKSLKQNEATPTNQNQYSIVITQAGATTVTPSINGNTKNYSIASSSYVITKGNTGDAAFTLTTDTSVANVVKTVITFNYDVQSGYILNAIAANPTLLNQLNSLVSGGSGSIIGLDGKCVIDLSKSDYAVSQSVTSSTLISSITIGGVVHNAPDSTFANNSTAVASWLNSLSLGTFTAVNSGGTLTIQSVANSNIVSTITFTSPNITKQFSATNATILQVLQAIINYLCSLNDSQVVLKNVLALCTFDYNGNVISTNFNSNQSVYNAGVASAICNIVSRMNSLTAVTCTTLKAIFTDNPSVSFGTSDRVYGTLGGNCASLTDQQLAKVVIAAVGKYSDVKTAWCAISCTAPSTCPDISNTSINMSGANIGIYGLTWSSVPVATQTVSVKYRVSGTVTWTVVTNSLAILPNGNINGSTPFLITGTSTGTTYDVQLINNCGGIGFTKQITTPTGSVYTGSYYLDNIIYNICGETPVTLYSSNPFAPGVIMYSDIGLTTPIAGYTFITTPGQGIYALDVSTGLVGVDTGSTCTSGTEGTYILGNDTATICGNSSISLYTDGLFAIGKTLYTDLSLTNPQTGYSYVVYNGGSIYTVNSATGVITGTTGSSCTNYTLSSSYGMSINSVTGTGVPTLPATGLNSNQYGHHEAMSGSYSIVLSGTPATTIKLDAYVNAVKVDCVAVSGAGTYNLSITATAADLVMISVDSGICT